MYQGKQKIVYTRQMVIHVFEEFVPNMNDKKKPRKANGRGRIKNKSCTEGKILLQ